MTFRGSTILFLASLATLAGNSQLTASSAYLPSPQTGNIHPVTTLQWARDFWFDDHAATLPGTLSQVSAGAEIEYGVTSNAAVDLTVGYSWVNYQGGPLSGVTLTQNNKNTRQGFADVRAGLSWRLVDEFASLHEAMPTITLRVGAIIAGNYDTGFVNAVSDGASGWELGFKVAKTYLPFNGGYYGDFSYRWLSTSVPDEWEASVGLFKNLGGVTLSAGLREKQSVGGIDILGPGFNLDRFTDVREKNRTAEFGATWALTAKNSLSLGFAHTLDGENSPKKNVIVSAASFGF